MIVCFPRYKASPFSVHNIWAYFIRPNKRRPYWKPKTRIYGLTSQLKWELAIKLTYYLSSFFLCSVFTNLSLLPVTNEQRRASEVGNGGSSSVRGGRRRTFRELGECGAVLFGGDRSFNLHLPLIGSFWKVHVHSTDFLHTFRQEASSFCFPKGSLSLLSVSLYTFVYVFDCVGFFYLVFSQVNKK